MATYNAKTLTITNNGDNYIIDPLQGNDVAYRDITVDIDAEDWTLSNNVYSYVWTNSYLTQNSQVQVYFKANVRGGLTGDLRVQKTTGQITFSTGEEPTDDISLLVRIIDANTTGILPINADMVETDAIVGETDVQGALEDLDERVRESSHDTRGYYIGSFDSMTALKTALIALAAAHCPSAVGSTDPQTVVNFSFYPNFTDTTAGFYPVSYGERIGTMYIRTADILSCIITFRDGFITKMAYDGTWKVDKLASESVLGDPSSASAVTGNDAFSKINSLNSNIMPQVVSGASIVSAYASGSDLTVYRVGKIVVVGGYVNGSIPAYADVITGLPIPVSTAYRFPCKSNTNLYFNGFITSLRIDGTVENPTFAFTYVTSE